MEAADLQPKEDHSALLLRQFASARDRDDIDAARRAWNGLLELRFDSVAVFVRQEAGGRLSHAEQEDAVASALERIAVDLFRTFNGTTVGEYVNAVRRLVHFACIDTQRRAQKHSGHRADLIHSGEDGHESLSAQTAAALIRHAADEATDEDDAEADALLYATGREFLDFALPQLREKRRAVIELDLQNVPIEEIQERLEMGRDAVYQNRKRATDDLLRLAAEWRAR